MTNRKRFIALFVALIGIGSIWTKEASAGAFCCPESILCDGCPAKPTPDIPFPRSRKPVFGSLNELRPLNQHTVPFKLIDNRIVLRITLNGRGPFWVLFDTGGQNIVTPEVATALGLVLTDPFQIGGAGGTTITAWHSRVSEMQIGGLNFSDQALLVLPLNDIKSAIGFRHFDGIVGQEMLAQFVTKIDFSHRELTFVSPSDYSSPAEGVTIPLTFYQDAPVIEAEIDGLKGQFALDTGDRSSLTLCSPFVKSHNLIEKYRPKFETITGWGVGGPIPAQLTRVQDLDFHGFNLRSIVTRFPTLSGGAYTSPDIAGYIGNGVLKRFNIVFDYPNRQMTLKANSAFSHADPYDRSGMWLSEQDDGLFSVLAVIPGGPAEGAGIKMGDVVLAIDGRRAQGLFLPHVRANLSNPANALSVLALRTSQGTFRQAILLLRDLL